jgi:hypothetical protein
MKRLVLLLGVAAAALASPFATAPALAQSCPNDQNFALLDVDTEPFSAFLASKDHNGDGLVCQSRQFDMPPPGYPTPFIVIDNLS